MIKYNANKIERIKNINQLGIIMDEYLNFNEHIQYTMQNDNNVSN